LRDIQDIFLSSGTGTKAYSLFDLRQMREIISGSIRRLFDEAATLAKYQEAKAECLRKLALTETDLVRLDDIIAERERVVRSLQRQAGRLKAYDRLKAEEQGLRLVELRAEYDAVGRDAERARLDCEALEQADAGRRSEIHRLEEELRQQRRVLRDVQAHKDELAARARALGAELAESRSARLLAQQRIEFGRSSAAAALAERATLVANMTRLEQLFAETLARVSAAGAARTAAQEKLDLARARVTAAEQKLYSRREHEAALRLQLQTLLEGQRELESRKAHLSAALENQREAGERLGAEVVGLRERSSRAGGEARSVQGRIEAIAGAIAGTRHSRRSLEEEQARVGAARTEVRSRLSRLRDERAALDRELAVLRAAVGRDQLETGRAVLATNLYGDVARFLEIEPGWERACEAALSDVVRFLVVDGFDPAWPARLGAARPDLEFGLVEAGEGRSEKREARAQNEEAEAKSREPGAGRWAADAAGSERDAEMLRQHVKLLPGAPVVLEQLLGRVLVCDSPTSFAAARPGLALVTRDGTCRLADGRIVISSCDRGPLALGRVIADQSARLAAAEAEAARLVEEEQQLTARRGELDAQLSATELGLFESEREKSSLDATLAAVAAAHDELGRDVARTQAELSALAAARRATEARFSENATALAELAEQIAGADEALRRFETETAAAEQVVRANLDGSAAALAELSETRQTLSRLETENAFAKRQIDELRFRINGLDRSAAKAHDESAELEAGLGGQDRAIAAVEAALRQAETEVAGLAAPEIERAVESLEANLGELRQSQEQSANLAMEQRLKLHELTRRKAGIEEEARASCDADIRQLPVEAAPDAADRLRQLRNRLEALGQVNPLAIEELGREKSDLDRLHAQREDVAQARTNLGTTLSELDRHAQEHFLSTYGLVRGHFQQVFRELFLEGEADLVLTNEADPLQTEIAITARPRGKTPKRLEQLSDGEKALLAVSLLFAFYRVKPAPFCFMDEVDAPLDDANAGRFADYLRRIAGATQVIIITHNRLTVERADVVFGVTAEQPGVSKLVAVSLAEYRSQAGEPETQHPGRQMSGDE
jgi:chromosome segregation protein